LYDYLFALVVWVEARGLLPTEIGDVQALGGQVESLCEQLPSPSADLFLEVVAERPVSHHLEKGVVVDVFADVVEVVVFTPGTDTFLRIYGSRQFREVAVRVYRAQKDRLELIHTGVGK
jgi:hypothetical protein